MPALGKICLAGAPTVSVKKGKKMSAQQTGLVPFSETEVGSQTAVLRSFTIKLHITEAFSDPEVWQDIGPYLVPNGITGSRQFDHAIVADKVLRASPALQGFENLPLVTIWKYVMQVLKKRQYTLQNGYIVGMESESEPEHEQSE